MGEREALLRAVCENPDDDLPRLVFADWLEEYGDPDRAEFIRGEIELDRQPGYPDDFGSEHDGLNSKLIAYLKKWEWRRDLAVGGDIEVVWSRGFVDTLRCGTRDWLESGVTVLGTNPVRKVEFGDTEDIACVEFVHESNHVSPWQLCFFRSVGAMRPSGGWRTRDRGRLVAGCPGKIATWLRDSNTLFMDLDS